MLSPCAQCAYTPTVAINTAAAGSFGKKTCFSKKKEAFSELIWACNRGCQFKTVGLKKSKYNGRWHFSFWHWCWHRHTTAAQHWHRPVGPGIGVSADIGICHLTLGAGIGMGTGLEVHCIWA